MRPEEVHQEAKRRVVHAHDRDVEAPRAGPPPAPHEENRERDRDRELEQAEIETPAVGIAHRPPDLARAARVIVRDRAAEAPEAPAYRERAAERVRVREQRHSMPRAPDEPREQRPDEAAEAREAVPEPDERERILEYLPRVVKQQVEHVPAHEAQHGDVQDEGHQRALAQAAPLCPGRPRSRRPRRRRARPACRRA